MSPGNLRWRSEQGRGQEPALGTLKTLCRVSGTVLPARVGLGGFLPGGLRAPHCACSPVTIASGY